VRRTYPLIEMRVFGGEQGASGGVTVGTFKNAFTTLSSYANALVRMTWTKQFIIELH